MTTGNTMRLHVRGRLLLWLFASTLPVFAAGVIIVDRVSDGLSDDVAEELMQLVVVEAQHMCMMMRGVQKQDSIMTTSCMLGNFRTQPQTREEFLRLIKD